MARLYAQATTEVLSTGASLAANGNITGSAICHGYAKLVGMLYSNASGTASAVRIQQSSNYGATWDYEALYPIAASVASVFSLELYGNAVKVSASMGAGAASLFRASFSLRPI